MKISNRDNELEGGWLSFQGLNKDIQLTFSDSYTTEVNALVGSLTMAHQTMGKTNILPNLLNLKCSL